MLDLGDTRRELLAPCDEARHADPAARELFGHQRVFEDTQAEPAVLGGNQQPEEPQLRHLLAQGHRDLAGLRVQLVGDRQHLCRGELARELHHGLLLVGQRHDAESGHRPRYDGL